MRAAILPILSVLLLGNLPVVAQDRLPDIPADKLTDTQKKASEDFLAARKVPVFGPFVPLLRSPELMTNASNMGLHLRYRSALPLRLSEFIILITAREWTQQLEWHIHQPIALKAGLDPAIVTAIQEGRRPDVMGEEEALTYAFSTELHRNKAVSDVTYKRVLEKFGEQGAIDMAGINGYYTLLAMTLNMAQTALPAGSSPQLPPLIR
ncbi:carboxymuconolactone decarboxylase family protein [Methylobacterium sp. BTF04]|uniref:carboxymuconolactone decarboxylase family protein n=1 Tax=Methylobacterium sp. BTF04 TaxID=2708300 RepID=UPI0013CFC03A|nr:carboxymuconolactone decarboxylase family protein [Methylobacterium sp. BTF04]NEU12275.1 carboxymuconolactone decarboxylase family protein [Methylobacterium sp. BTF04]